MYHSRIARGAPPSFPKRSGACMLAMFLGLGLGIAGSAQAALDPGLLIVSDFMPPAKVRVLDPARGVIVYDYQLDKETSEACSDRRNRCYPTGMSYARHNGDDAIDMAVTVQAGASTSPADRFYSVIQRVQPATPAKILWKIKNLDFSGVPDGSHYCNYNPQDPRGNQKDPSCRMAFTEGFRVIDDRPSEKKVTVVAADGNFGRVLQLTLDYTNGNTCAKVDWVLGELNPDWPGPDMDSFAWPNGVDYIVDTDGERYLLVDYYLSYYSETTPGGSAIHLFRWTGADWTLDWQFPDPSLSGENYLNTPHMSEFMVDPLTGQRYIWYSHSRGAASTWMAEPDGYGASFGVLKVGASLSDPPAYLFDLSRYDATGRSLVMFARDQDYLPDGSLLLTDAGCQNVCGYEPAVYRTTSLFANPQPSTKVGGYTPDGTHQNRVNIADSQILETWKCGFGALFEVEYLPNNTLGPTLTNLARTATKRCTSR